MYRLTIKFKDECWLYLEDSQTIIVPPKYNDEIYRYFNTFSKVPKKINLDTLQVYLNNQDLLMHWLFVNFEATNLTQLYLHSNRIRLKTNCGCCKNFFNYFSIRIEKVLIKNLKNLLKNKYGRYIEYLYISQDSGSIEDNPTGCDEKSNYFSELNVDLVRSESSLSWSIQRFLRDTLSRLQPPIIRGGGLGIKLIDIEGGWYSGRMDLAYNVRNSVVGNNNDMEHGGKVLGVLLSNNSSEVLGLVPNADIYLVSKFYPDETVENVPRGLLNAIWTAIFPEFQYGNVILLECQTEEHLPIEYERAVYDLIRFATYCLGVIIVEAGGNLGTNLNINATDGFPEYLRSHHGSISGAILVGAVDSFTNQIDRDNILGNYGSRIDCYVWGSCIRTTLGDNNLFTYFKQTSAASAIVAGIVTSLQSIAEVQFGRRLYPWEIRKLLFNNTTLTYDLFDFTQTFVMPNLNLLVSQLSAYLRDGFPLPVIVELSGIDV